MANTKMYLRLNVRREMLILFLYTVICNLIAINIGATAAYSSVVLPILTNNTSSIILSATEVPLFASVILATRIVGCLSCPITMIYGRRCNFIICGVIFSLGWTLIASSYNVTQLFIGRALTGFASGMCSYAIEIYLSEISTTSWREVLTITPTLMYTIGILVVYFLGFVIQNNWRLIAALFTIPSMSVVLCIIYFMAESPMWLLLKGRKEAARMALLQIRGLRQETIEFQEEFARMVNYSETKNNLEISRNCQLDFSSAKEMGKWAFLARSVCSKLKSIQRITLLPEVWKPFVIINTYFLFQEFCGSDVFIFYAVDINIILNITMDPFLVIVIVGIISLISNVFMAFCSKRIGRRAISIVSGVGTAISLGALMMYLQFFENTGVAAIPLVCIFLYTGFGSFGIFSIIYSLIAELYPTKYINVLGLLTIIFSTFWSVITVQLYPMMVTQDRNATFYFYCVISIIGTIFITIALPETRGKTKAQIEEAFRGKLKVEETFRKIEGAC